MTEKTVLASMSEDARRALAEFENAAAAFGPFVVEAKKTTLHFRPLCDGKKPAAFAGARPLKSGLRLTLVLTTPPRSPRILKSEQVSASRWHVELVLLGGKPVDAALKYWIGAAYSLQTGGG